MSELKRYDYEIFYNNTACEDQLDLTEDKNGSLIKASEFDEWLNNRHNQWVSVDVDEEGIKEGDIVVFADDYKEIAEFDIEASELSECIESGLQSVWRLIQLPEGE